MKQQYLWNIAIQTAVGCSAYNLTYVVRMLTARGKIIVKRDYYDQLFCMLNAIYHILPHTGNGLIPYCSQWSMFPEFTIQSETKKFRMESWTTSSYKECDMTTCVLILISLLFQQAW